MESIEYGNLTIEEDTVQENLNRCLNEHRKSKVEEKISEREKDIAAHKGEIKQMQIDIETLIGLISVVEEEISKIEEQTKEEKKDHESNVKQIHRSLALAITKAFRLDFEERNDNIEIQQLKEKTKEIDINQNLDQTIEVLKKTVKIMQDKENNVRLSITGAQESIEQCRNRYEAQLAKATEKSVLKTTTEYDSVGVEVSVNSTDREEGYVEEADPAVLKSKIPFRTETPERTSEKSVLDKLDKTPALNASSSPTSPVLSKASTDNESFFDPEIHPIVIATDSNDTDSSKLKKAKKYDIIKVPLFSTMPPSTAVQFEVPSYEDLANPNSKINNKFSTMPSERKIPVYRGDLNEYASSEDIDDSILDGFLNPEITRVTNREN